MSLLITPENKKRSFVLDQLRGVAVVFMVLFHFTYDLKIFANTPPLLVLELPKWFWFWVPAAIGSTFLFVSGLSLKLSRSEYQNGSLQKKDLLRLTKLGGVALLITIFSLFFLPSAPIYFGIIHCIAFGSLLVLLLRKMPSNLIMVLGALLVVGGIILEFTEPLSFSWLNWLGFRSKQSPLVSDYYPVMPFAGVMLLGYGFPVKIFRRHQPEEKERRPKVLNFLGRHSLVIYLVHQPILIGLVRMLF